MPRPLAGQSVQEFRHITEQPRKGRRRLKSEAIPEIVAWLTVRIILAQERLHAIQNRKNKTSSRGVGAFVMEIRNEIDLLNDLIACVADEWPKSDWDEAVVRVARAMQIHENRQLPKTIRDVSLVPPMSYEYDGFHEDTRGHFTNPTG